MGLVARGSVVLLLGVVGMGAMVALVGGKVARQGTVLRVCHMEWWWEGLWGIGGLGRRESLLFSVCLSVSLVSKVDMSRKRGKWRGELGISQLRMRNGTWKQD